MASSWEVNNAVGGAFSLNIAIMTAVVLQKSVYGQKCEPLPATTFLIFYACSSSPFSPHVNTRSHQTVSNHYDCDLQKIYKNLAKTEAMEQKNFATGTGWLVDFLE